MRPEDRIWVGTIPHSPRTDTNGAREFLVARSPAVAEEAQDLEIGVVYPYALRFAVDHLYHIHDYRSYMQTEMYQL